MRSYVLCKVLGGILMVLGIPAAILVLIVQIPAIAMMPPHPAWAALPAAVGSTGLVLFVIGDRRLRASREGAGRAGLSWKVALIAVAVLFLWFFAGLLRRIYFCP